MANEFIVRKGLKAIGNIKLVDTSDNNIVEIYEDGTNATILFNSNDGSDAVEIQRSADKTLRVGSGTVGSGEAKFYTYGEMGASGPQSDGGQLFVAPSSGYATLGQNLGSYEFREFGTTGTRARITGVATQNQDSTNHGTKLEFYVNRTGNYSPTKILDLNYSTGIEQIGTTTAADYTFNSVTGGGISGTGALSTLLFKGSTYGIEGGKIEVERTEAWTSSGQKGADMVFYTAKIGGAAIEETLRLNPNLSSIENDFKVKNQLIVEGTGSYGYISQLGELGTEHDSASYIILDQNNRKVFISDNPARANFNTYNQPYSELVVWGYTASSRFTAKEGYYYGKVSSDYIQMSVDNVVGIRAGNEMGFVLDGRDATEKAYVINPGTKKSSGNGALGGYDFKFFTTGSQTISDYLANTLSDDKPFLEAGFTSREFIIGQSSSVSPSYQALYTGDSSKTLIVSGNVDIVGNTTGQSGNLTVGGTLTSETGMRTPSIRRSGSSAESQEIVFDSDSVGLYGNPIFHGDVNVYSQSAFLGEDDELIFRADGVSGILEIGGPLLETKIDGDGINIAAALTTTLTASAITASGNIEANNIILPVNNSIGVGDLDEDYINFGSSILTVASINVLSLNGQGGISFTGDITANNNLDVIGDISASNATITTQLTAAGLAYPTADGDNGDVLITDGAGNLSFARTTVYANVKNVHGSELVKGMPVHVTGAAGNTSEVVAASASNAATMPAHFILNETLADDTEGLAIAVGYINHVNTGDFNEGDTVYVGADGGYTNVKPTGSNLIQNLGIVDKVDASNGSGFILGAGRSNDVPNIASGYAWVGNSDSVATAVATSSFVVDNANTASYVAATNVDGTVASATVAVSAISAGSATLATTATNANNVSIASTSTNTEYGFVLRDGAAGGNQALYGDSETDQPSWNPSTNTLTITGVRKLPTTTAADQYYGDVVSFGGGGTLTIGSIYYLDSSQNWQLADASASSTAQGMLGIATSTSTILLVRGIARHVGWAGLGHGSVLYLSETAGELTTTAPTTAGTIVRVIGYCTNTTTREIYFNPSQDWLEN